MPHPKYNLEYRKQIGSKFGDKQLPQQIIDYIHEMAEVGGSDEDIRVSILDHFDSMAQMKLKNSKLLGYSVSLASIFKYAKDARDVIKGQNTKEFFTVREQKFSRIIELSKLGLQPMQVHRRMKQEGFKISKRFIRTYMQGFVDKYFDSLPEISEQVQPQDERVVIDGVVQLKAGEKVQPPPMVGDAGVVEEEVSGVSLDDILNGFDEEQQVSEEMETLEWTSIATVSTMVQVYQNALNQIDAVIRPSIVKGLEAAKQLEDTNSVLAELEFLRKAMDIPNSILESQRADQETTIQQVASNQSQAVMKALYEEQQAKRDVEIQRKAYQDANAGEGSLNQRT